jgi:hypothetical protein
LAPLPIYPPLNAPLPPESTYAAKQVVHDLLAESLSDARLFDSFVSFLYMENTRRFLEGADVERFRERTLQIIQESSIRAFE